MLTNSDMEIPKEGKIYSCNEGNYYDWSPGVQAYVDWLKTPGNGPEGRAHTHRYVGSLVADFHRTLLKGGIFMYPADKKNTRGKLRHLYECAPMAFLAEQAGGKASDGSVPILDITPQAIHDRVPIFFGSSSMVERAEQFISEKG